MVELDAVGLDETQSSAPVPVSHPLFAEERACSRARSRPSHAVVGQTAEVGTPRRIRSRDTRLTCPANVDDDNDSLYAGVKSQKTKPSRWTTSPVSHAICSVKIGPVWTKVWNSPFSPQGSTLGGSSARS
jgi:hypothetical protein